MSKPFRLSETLTELYRICDLFSEKFFENKIECPIIVIKPASKGNVLGSCSVNKVWRHRDEASAEARYEISISAEHLNRPIEDICATLLHEMVHLHNAILDIKDTSANHVYHNRKFKTEAEKRGLLIEHAKTIGYSVTTLQEDTRELIKSFHIDEKLFDFHRKGVPVAPKIKVDLTAEEKLDKLYERLDKIKVQIQELEAEVK